MHRLDGRTIGLLESRRSEDLATMVRRLGGTPVAAPAVREVPHPEAVEAALDAVANDRFQVAVFLTGVGATTFLREAERRGRLPEVVAALERLRLACRGPKPIAALKRYGLQPSVTTERPHTTTELIEALAGHLSQADVLLVHYGERNDAIADALRSRGARVEEVCPYVWAMPEDVAPLSNLVREAIARRIDAVLFTSQIQARHLFEVAGDMTNADDLRAALNEDVVVAAIGPVCADALKQLGVRADVIPATGHMGALVAALADYFDLVEGTENKN